MVHVLRPNGRYRLLRKNEPGLLGFADWNFIPHYETQISTYGEALRMARERSLPQCPVRVVMEFAEVVAEVQRSRTTVTREFDH